MCSYHSLNDLLYLCSFCAVWSCWLWCFFCCFSSVRPYFSFNEIIMITKSWLHTSHKKTHYCKIGQLDFTKKSILSSWASCDEVKHPGKNWFSLMSWQTVWWKKMDVLHQLKCSLWVRFTQLFCFVVRKQRTCVWGRMRFICALLCFSYLKRLKYSAIFLFQVWDLFWDLNFVSFIKIIHLDDKALDVWI